MTQESKTSYLSEGGHASYPLVRNDEATRAATTLIGRPEVRYAFEPKPVELDAYIALNVASPTTILTRDVDHAGTKTSHDDGSADYRYTADRGVKVTLHVNDAGVLTSARGTTSKSMFALSYRYGPQHVTLPAAAVTVDLFTLRRAMAYLSMPRAVKQVVEKGASITRSEADGKKVKVSTLRATVRRLAASWNSAGRDKVQIKVDRISDGVRVAAMNPWTHEKVSYAITASDREVLVQQD